MGGGGKIKVRMNGGDERGCRVGRRVVKKNAALTTSKLPPSRTCRGVGGQSKSAGKTAMKESGEGMNIKTTVINTRQLSVRGLAGTKDGVSGGTVFEGRVGGQILIKIGDTGIHVCWGM